jgi:hypothetical protein
VDRWATVVQQFGGEAICSRGLVIGDSREGIANVLQAERCFQRGCVSGVGRAEAGTVDALLTFVRRANIKRTEQFPISLSSAVVHKAPVSGSGLFSPSGIPSFWADFGIIPMFGTEVAGTPNRSTGCLGRGLPEIFLWKDRDPRVVVSMVSGHTERAAQHDRCTRHGVSSTAQFCMQL